MSLYGYTFLQEVTDFNIDSYVQHLAWVDAKPATLKIYSKDRSLSYFLHDEISNRLFEFYATPGKKLNNEQEHENVLRTYMVAYPENGGRNE